ncbi:hypothetical protein ACFOEE_04045 [Pseudoalteromonas fenneropenaei]|uniref:TonB C-terminal domain-containing protein n=1 Tax=Pseudoalteromonas fenneropenaei TaxID=1737459 RepID=A0ABV7CGP1_9GAMM
MKAVNNTALRWFKGIHRRALLASVTLIMLLMLLLQGITWLSHYDEPELVMRKVDLALPLPPPPPPPPPVSSSAEPEQLALAVPGAGASLPITLDLSAPSIDVALAAPNMTLAEPEWQNVEVDWQAVSLDTLDGLPTLLTPVRIAFPKSLERQGIKSVLVKLDVVIDEQGTVNLVNVVSNPYPELKPQIDKLVKQSRFTAPTQAQQPVRARFIWPVELSH